MKTKNLSAYDAVFEAVKSKIAENIIPERAITDYEVALQKSLRVAYPTAEVNGCYFHYTQVSIDTYLFNFFISHFIKTCVFFTGAPKKSGETKGRGKAPDQ